MKTAILPFRDLSAFCNRPFSFRPFQLETAGTGCAQTSRMGAPIQPRTLPAYEHGEDIRLRTFRFACRVIAACDAVYDSHRVGRLLVAQLIGCSTSTAAMLEEARAAESIPDFISKSSIALKECRESWMRLRIFQARRIGDPKEITTLVSEANELVSILTTIVANARRNARLRRQHVRDSSVPNS